MAKAKYIGKMQTEVDVNGFVVKTDIPKSMGGDNEYPGPLDLLQAALLSCATTHAILFFKKFNIDPSKLTTELEPVFNENGDIIEASILLYISGDFPADKEKALIGVVENCIVGRHVKFPRNVVVVRQ